MDEARSLSGPDPARVSTIDDLARELGLLRSRAARGTRSARVSLEELATRTGEPRSTIHAYLTGKRFAPAQVLDRMVIALGASAQEQRDWAEAWYRVGADRDNAHRAPSPAPISSADVPRQLPTSVDNFTGRAEQILELDELLVRPDAGAIAVISGSAGVGKTALALQWAHGRANRFPDGQLYIDLHGFDVRSPATTVQALRRFLRALGWAATELPDDEDELAARFRSIVAGRRMLLVLDNAADAEQVRPLLPGNGPIAVLVTSRHSLTGLIARHGARRITIDGLPAADAVTLLSRLGVGGEPGQLRSLAEHCARLPLALRLAAEQLEPAEPSGLDELIEELASTTRLLDRLEAGEDPSTDLRTVLGWSTNRLTPDLVRAYRLSSLHPGPDLSVAALAALLGSGPLDAQRAQATLVRLHVGRQPRPGHLMLHRIQRAHARELVAADELDAFVRLAEHFLLTAARAIELVAGKRGERRPELTPVGPWTVPLVEVEAGRSWLAAERANVVAVAAEVIQDGGPKGLLRLAHSVAAHLDGIERVIHQLRPENRETGTAAAAAMPVSLKR